MTTEALATTTPQTLERGMMPLAEVVARVRRIQEVMATLMKPDVHFGTIPGTPKPTLYQPGAELLCSTFRIAPAPRVEDLSTPDTVRYRVTMRAVLQTTGEMLGEGVGECSSDEEKYRWRKPVCDEEWQETPEDRRREKWMRGRRGETYKQKQVRLSPADIANTILKMAFKRALISMVRVTLACSDIFAQDLEDLPVEVREAVVDAERQEAAQPPPIQPPKAKSETLPGQERDSSRHVPPPADAKTGRLYVTGVEAHPWERDGKKGFVFHVKFSDEREAATFSESVARLAELCRDEQAPVEAIIEESKKRPGKHNLTELIKTQSDQEPAA